MATLEGKVGEEIEIEMTDEERVLYLTMYAKENCRPESFQVFQDVLEEQKDINAALAQCVVNEMVIEALTAHIESELHPPD